MISSEDSLFSYISSRICSDPESLDLLRFVRFEYLSSERISDFFSALPDSIDRHLWKSISGRLARSQIPPISPSMALKGVEFPLQYAESVEGIIFYLTQKHGGNVHEKEILTITSKSVLNDSPGMALRNVADLTSYSYFQSKNAPGQWICWDFHEMRVRPAHYTIQSCDLKRWVVESSLNGEAWTEIDRKTDFKDNWTWHIGMASFAVSNSAECRFIRLTQTGKTDTGKDILDIQAFEVFGTLLE
jgi:hypothetical protein